MLIIGERINTSRKEIDEAVAKRDKAYIQADMVAQVEAGADLIDVNAGSRKSSEVADLIWLIEVIQVAVPKARLCLDSANPDSLKAVLGYLNHLPMINSTTAEKVRFKSMASVIQAKECDVIALCIDDRGIPKSVGETLNNAARLIKDLEALGVRRERIYLDPIIKAVCTDQTTGLMALEVIESFHREFPDVKTVCGLSNISYGMPKRSLINRTFLPLAMRSGLTAAIIDPLDKRLMGTLMAANLLLGQDKWCRTYLKAFRNGRLED